jgi:potassium/hydrogen antiporter
MAPMADATHFGAVIGLVALVLGAAVAGNRISSVVRLPAPVIFLVAAAVASDVVPSLGRLSIVTVQDIVTVALLVILLDGGMHIGWHRFRSNAGAVAWLGVAGTMVTALALAAAGHLVFGLPWRDALLVGTALAPTDPAVVFSVLGGREVEGRSGTLLEGESGANDPVGIALMAALLTASGDTGWHAVGRGALEFVLQMGVGAAVGLLGGRVLLWTIRRTTLPAEGLYSLRVLAGAGVLFGAATVAHGSGFLAVFVAGIVLGDERAPYKRDIERFHSTLASLGEIIAFTVLGLTVSLRSLPDGHAWEIGLALGALLAFVVRPLLVGALLLPVRLARPERAFVLWAGLKGAVPILLGTFVLQDELRRGDPVRGTRLYDVVFVVVAFSVIVQGGLVPAVARWVGVPRACGATSWPPALRPTAPASATSVSARTSG